jgi:hypothetical protein
MKKFTLVVVAAVVAVVGLFGTSVSVTAQDSLAVVTTAAPIYLLPDVTRIPLRTLEVRDYLRIRENQGEWLRVDFQDLQFGVRTGYIQARFVRLIRLEHDGQSEWVTVDLGLKAPIPRPVPTASREADTARHTSPAKTTPLPRSRTRQ